MSEHERIPEETTIPDIGPAPIHPDIPIIPQRPIYLELDGMKIARAIMQRILNEESEGDE